jgi:hypothetical protein
MLQIASGMYFTTTDLHETVHRRTVYSNGIRARADDVELPIGTLRFTNGHGAILPLTIEATDRLEKVNSDGSNSFHVATGGDELIDDVADVVAFGLDVVVLSDPDLAERVVAGTSRGGRRATKLLRRTVEPARYLTDQELDGLREFSAQLLALHTPHFEGAMRAIRRVADATTLTASDVTLAYTLFVAALESLSKEAVAPPLPWADYDKGKREIIEAATEGLSPERAQGIHAAVLKVDQLALRRRYQGFVLDHLTEDYFRSGAIGAIRPARAVDLPKALDFAYRVRSLSMHELRDLAPELWLLSGHDETTWHDGRTVLTLEGLHRLCQQVIREYVRRAPTGIDIDFQANYRATLPGIARVRLAAQMWIAQQSGFPARQGPMLFSGLVEMIDGAMRGEKGSIVTIAKPLEHIETLLSGEAKAKARLPLIATYVLWDLFAPDEHKQPNAERVIAAHVKLLDAPSIYALAVGVLAGRELPWTENQLVDLVDGREASLRRATKSTVELPPRLDAAFQIELAQRAWSRHDVGAALARLAKAVELLPGDEKLIAIEAEARQGSFEALDLRDFIVGPDPEQAEGAG